MHTILIGASQGDGSIHIHRVTRCSTRHPFPFFSSSFPRRTHYQHNKSIIVMDLKKRRATRERGGERESFPTFSSSIGCYCGIVRSYRLHWLRVNTSDSLQFFLLLFRWVPSTRKYCIHISNWKGGSALRLRLYRTILWLWNAKSNKWRRRRRKSDWSVQSRRPRDHSLSCSAELWKSKHYQSGTDASPLSGIRVSAFV